MHRFTVSLAVVVVLLVGTVSTISRSTAAQDATSETATPVTEMVMEGITIEDLAASQTPAFPPGPVDVALVRLRFEPGGRFAVPGVDDLGVALILVESGTITARSTDVLMVTRGAMLATPGPLTRSKSPPRPRSASRRAIPSSPRRGPGGSSTTTGPGSEPPVHPPHAGHGRHADTVVDPSRPEMRAGSPAGPRSLVFHRVISAPDHL